MKTIKFLSLLLIGFTLQAQDLQQAKNAIDAEQYQKAKTILKSLVNSNPDKGENFYYLADIYLIQKEQDSAKLYLNQGLKAKNNAHLNYIGLGHIDLNNNNIQGATTNFNKATENIRRRDTEELIQVGRAYINSDNPNYKKAIEYLNRAVQADSKSAVALMYLGDAYLGDKNTNDAFRSYRDALNLDKDLKRAKLQMAVITKNAKAFPEAIKSFNEIVSTDPNYGPVYRELAETYYYWGTDDVSKYQEYNNKALENYRKYMSLTDTSLDSRMRYADFLILTRDYATLEIEANKMKQEQNVNPRIYRYLGYAAFENQNYEESVDALTNFFEKGNKFISRDYIILAKAKLAMAKKDGEIIDMAKFEEALADLESAVAQDTSFAGEFSQLGEELYKDKLYFAAAKVFSLAVKDTQSTTNTLDNMYLGNAVLFHASNVQNEKIEKGEEFTEEEKQEIIDFLQMGSTAYENVITASPTTQDAHANKAKINRIIDSIVPNEEAIQTAVKSYENYIQVVHDKGEAELSKDRTKRELLAGHMFLGAEYTKNNDKAKALEHFETALTLNPSEANETYIRDSINVLKGS